jgi:hypothetical protein
MSWKNWPPDMRAKRNQQDRSRKDCICGGNSAGDVKKNLHHNSTISRLQIKQQRQFKMRQGEFI